MLTRIFQILDAIRIPLAIAIILPTGFWGFVVTFSDHYLMFDPTILNTVLWIGYVAIWHIPGGLLLGFLFPNRWYLSLLVGWAALGMLLLFIPYLVPLFAGIVLGTGYIGKTISQWLRRSKKLET
jgi:hypothetical protein